MHLPAGCILSIISEFKNIIILWGNKNSFKNNSVKTFQITRTIFALTSLITIIFNTNDTFFLNNSFKVNDNILFSDLTFFKLIGYNKIEVSKIIYILVLLFVISGYLYKFTSIIHWYITLSFSYDAYNIDSGELINSVICLLLIPIALLDTRENAWKSVSESKNSSYKIFLSNISLRFVQLQIAVIYFISGISKLSVPEWRDGTAYYYWFNDNAVGAPSYIKAIVGNLFSNAFITCSVTWGTILFEILLFCCYFSKDKIFRKAMFILGLCFHLFIAIIHGIPSFSIVMIGCLILYLRSD